MHSRRKRRWRRLLASTVLAAGMIAGSSVPASAAVTAVFSSGALNVLGDTSDNNIAVSRDAAGKLLVNGGAVAVLGGTPTVANTTVIRGYGRDGQDTITLNEASGALPAANLFGGTGNDILVGGSGNDSCTARSGPTRSSARAASTC
jgi:Ca2+-binding RTX toxin-like protein